MLKVQLNDDQKEAFKAIQRFIDHPAANVFVLKGYAGTGKTFLMQHFAKWLQEKHLAFTLLASTGRAATVLKGKTGFDAKTVHGELYRFSKVDGDDDEIPEDAPSEKYGQMTLQFSLRQPDSENQIYIIDEASMLSSEITDSSSLASFGSGMLLVDFFEAVGNNKIIFVGDPCQLPPVGQAFSPALDMDWLNKMKRTAVSFTLNKIERTKDGNDILKLASSVRDLSLQTSWEKFPRLPASGLNDVHLHASDEALFKEYVLLYKKVGSNGTLAIARTNKTVQHINRATRRELYGELDLPIQATDILLVVQNNYAVPLTNGDFVSVKELGEIVVQAGLHFQKIKVTALLSEIEFELLLSLDVLYGNSGNLTKEQLKALMIDFSRRMKRRGIKANTEEYKLAMMQDPYLNCLRATYGYAVTCHKAQGGEWDETFLFLDKSMYGMPRAELCRWWYTAITRARLKLNLTQTWWIK